jgi:archaellin
VREQAITKDSFDNAQAFFKKGETEKATGVKLDDSVSLKEMNTKHANYINQLKVYASNAGKPQVISTSDINGFINYWDLSSL